MGTGNPRKVRTTQVSAAGKKYHPLIFTFKNGEEEGVLSEREGTMGCLSLKSPKFYKTVFLFVGLSTLGTLMNFDWLVY